MNKALESPPPRRIVLRFSVAVMMTMMMMMMMMKLLTSEQVRQRQRRMLRFRSWERLLLVGWLVGRSLARSFVRHRWLVRCGEDLDGMDLPGGRPGSSGRWRVESL
ncbi:hypothetical protein IWX50DRAFT_264681 [Phyllosticta citricarpa]